MTGQNASFPPEARGFGVLRLFLAVLVLVSHAAELVQGDDWLRQQTGAFTLADIGIGGFFVVSGYLAAGSYARKPGPASYLAGRVLRIVPAYAVWFIVCVAVVAPLGGGEVPVLANLGNLARLLPPEANHDFAGLGDSELNHPMWTVAHGMRVFVIVALLGWLGVYRRFGRIALLIATAGLMVAHAFDILDGVWIPASTVFGYPADTLRYLTLFAIGAVHHAWRDRIPLTAAGTALSLAAMTALLFAGTTVPDLGIAAFGGYALLWAAGKLPALGERWDVSYGLYLMCWPVLLLTLWWAGPLDPAPLIAIALPLTAALGWLSQTLIERPARRLLTRRS